MATIHDTRVVVLIELQGGNDGLNMLIPFRDDAYYAARPTLAIPQHRVLRLSDDFGLHPAMTELLELWGNGDVALVHGVGYQQQNRSHFSSIDIWETASDGEQHKETGWLADVLMNQHGLQGVVIGDDLGPFTSHRSKAVIIRDLDTLLHQTLNLEPGGPVGINPALAHVTNIQQQIYDTASTIRSKLRHIPTLKDSFPKTALGRDLELTAQFILSDLGTPVYKVSLGGFDTHTHQAKRHTRLLQHLSEALAAFARIMQQTGLWHQIILMTYSEFGRRVSENGSGGTDHGAAAAHMLAGGAIRGGLHGKPPSLRDLHRGDLKFTTDFRQLYVTLIEKWWGTQLNRLRDYRPLPLIR